MSTQAAISGNPYKNNGGTVIKGGSVTTTVGNPFTKSRTLMDNAVTTGYGAQVSLSSGSTGSSGNVGTFKALTSGTFGYNMVAGRYVMKRSCGYINGTANTLLLSGASDSAERHLNPALITTAVPYGSGATASYNLLTGVFTKGGGAGNRYSFAGTAPLDDAARPTYAVPGELTYKTGAKLPVQDEYKPKMSS